MVLHSFVSDCDVAKKTFSSGVSLSAIAESVVEEAQQPRSDDDAARPPGQAQLAVQHLAVGAGDLLPASAW